MVGCLTLLAVLAALAHRGQPAFADRGRDLGQPIMTTGITVPASGLIALCHQTVRSTIVFRIVPLSCHHRVHGSQ